MRKIIHIDMDAFYASVELRENPHLKGMPVVVAWDSPRSVVCAASYEARRFGLHSAMSVAHAKQLCPQAVYIAPHFELYREISRQIRRIFEYYTHVIEPLSLDEAYLDVSEDIRHIGSATKTAELIRAAIVERTQLTASAGVATNKFIAKIASDWNKPNGICVVPPHKMMGFLLPLPLEKIPGVGKVTLTKLHRLKLFTVADMAHVEREVLVYHFGRYGERLYELAKGIDNRPVKEREFAKQISVETTFESDLKIEQMYPMLSQTSQQLWQHVLRKKRFARCLTLKLKTQHFKVITRRKTFDKAFQTEEQLHQVAIAMLASLQGEMPASYFRLIGLGVSTFEDTDNPAQPSLFF